MIRQIVLSGRSAFYQDQDGHVVPYRKALLIAAFDILPVVFLPFCIDNDVLTSNKEFVSHGLTVISIFAGLMFSVIVVIADKAKKRKVDIQKKRDLLISSKGSAKGTDSNINAGLNEEEINGVTRYLLFARGSISLISYAIILSLMIISITIVTQLDPPFIPDLFEDHQFLAWLFDLYRIVKDVLVAIKNFLVLYFGYQFLFLITAIIMRMYSFLDEETAIDEQLKGWR